MARGALLSCQLPTTFFNTSKCKLSLISPFLCSFKPDPLTHTLSFLCTCARQQHQKHSLLQPLDMSSYKETFSKRMAMAGLKPHHRIALGVSGGPDSMALCILIAAWKTEGLDAACKNHGFIDGLLAIIVDHGLRMESAEEARIVYQRVSEMGIRCEIARCEWINGRPTRGHLQEAAREMRYEIFQKVCRKHQFGVLLIAHHADDQAESFILRLSRNSGVLGLAGMAFTSQLFAKHANSPREASGDHGILLVRPLLDFAKEDLYVICQQNRQTWVEDPSNRSRLFVRNRIRISLRDFSSCTLGSELQALISACRRTRTYVDKICSDLITQAVTISDQGYAVINMEKLDPNDVGDIFLARFLAVILQFISQRYRPIRGSTSELLLDYIRTSPCKTSFTAAGCYLCPAPGSKGTKILVCCSVDCPLPSKLETCHEHDNEEHKLSMLNEVEEIIANARSFSDISIPDVSEVHFLNVRSGSVLTEAKRLNILSESSYRSILTLQEEEKKHFKPEPSTSGYEPEHVKHVKLFQHQPLEQGKMYSFMNRFTISWRRSNDFVEPMNLMEGQQCHCSFCPVNHNTVVEARHMLESDWLYLAELKRKNLENFQQINILPVTTMDSKQTTVNAALCLDYARTSAERALLLLKSIPVTARKSLPVLVNSEGVLLSIPTLCFKHCPCLTVLGKFNPRVPLGGGFSSFI